VSPAQARALVVLVVASLAVAGCGSPGASRDAAPDELLVSAAASLSDAFTELAMIFEREHPGTDVVLNLAGSAALREQVLAGAPVDVLATASLATMAPVVRAGATIGQPSEFAANELALVVPHGNPGGVTSLDDLATPALFVGLCDVSVPCGALADTVLAAVHISPSVDTRERDVRSLLTKLVSGDLDVGLVYATDARAAGSSVKVIADDSVQRLRTSYVIAALTRSSNLTGAAEFVALILSDEGQATLGRHGFLAP
jgi:molybdate transport system substrate-binding protein